MNISTQLSTVKKYLSTFIVNPVVIGAIIIVSGATLFLAPVHVLAFDYVILQPDHSTDVNGSITGATYTGITGTFNQVQWYQDFGSCGGGGCPVGGVLSSYKATSGGSSVPLNGVAGDLDNNPIYWSYNSTTHLVTTCLAVNYDKTSHDITLTNGTITTASNGYSTGYYGQVYGDGYHGHMALILSYNTSCANGYVPPSDTSTHFITTSPVNGDTVSSSSPVTIGAHIYVNADDYTSGMYLNLAFTSRAVQQEGGSALDAWNSATGNAGIQIPITGFGDMTLSTTTNFTYGGSATGVYSIRKPTFFSKLWFFGVYFSPETLVSTSTTFIVGQKTSLDFFNESTTTNNMISTFLTGTSTPIISCDNIFSGGLGTCLLSLIVPTSDSMNVAFTQLKDNVLNHAPLGYITRAVTIFTDQSAVSLPALSYKFGSSSPQVLQDYTASDPVSFNPFSSTYYSSTSPLMNIRADDGTNKNVWDIIDPFFTWLTIVGVFLAMLDDLMGMSMGSSQSGRQKTLEGYKDFSDKEIRNAIEKGGGMDLTEGEYQMRIKNRL